MDSAYNPKLVEDKIYAFWEKGSYFNAPPPPPPPLRGEGLRVRGKPYVIMMPPANITGELHIGHALTFVIEDVFVRYNRMNGVPTLWLTGPDPARTATQ